MVRTGILIDDFAFDERGRIYGASNADDTLLRIGRHGRTRTIADGSDGLAGPSAVAFGLGKDRRALYVMRPSFAAGSPSVQRLILRGG